MRTLDQQHYLLTMQVKRPSGSEHQYPFDIPAVAGLKKIDFHPQVTFFVGENGTGKSTLVEAIAVACGLNAEGGSRHFNFATKASHSTLHEHLILRRGLKRPRDAYFLRAESFYNVATNIEDLKAEAFYGGTSLHNRSHGEAFMALFINRLYGNGLYVLDEPEAALSPMRQLALLRCIHQLAAKNSQLIIATHSPLLLAYPDAWIYNIDNGGVERVAYEQTDHYIINKRFANNYQSMLHELLK